jgi:hypothetical protein
MYFAVVLMNLISAAVIPILASLKETKYIASK